MNLSKICYKVFGNVFPKEARILLHGQLGGFANTIHKLVLAACPKLHVFFFFQNEHVLRDLPRDLQYTSTSLDCSMREEQHNRFLAFPDIGVDKVHAMSFLFTTLSLGLFSGEPGDPELIALLGVTTKTHEIRTLSAALKRARLGDKEVKDIGPALGPAVGSSVQFEAGGGFTMATASVEGQKRLLDIGFSPETSQLATARGA